LKAANFDYHAPNSLNEALEMVASLENSRVLAGGQSLMPMLNLRLGSFDHLIDLGHVPELSGIERVSGAYKIGAMVRQRQIEQFEGFKKDIPLLYQAIRYVGHQQTRNRGTLGGSICHLDPSAEMPLVALTMDANLEVASVRGKRQIEFKHFFSSLLSSVLKPDEILTRIHIPLSHERDRCVFLEFSRRPADFSICAVAVVLRVDAQQKIENLKIGIGGLGPSAVRLYELEQKIIGCPWSSDFIEDIQSHIKTLPGEGDLDNTAAYRNELAQVLVKRALMQALQMNKESKDGQAQN
jgi:carbon-monoxide dehydrogenase medium subunit